eukprot:TRINITY_DN7281_c0_g1_i5.p3 TRINITY_DN7281_c0_g1~~TRINITY_DN7281_c0_g1_i5.p3  ORF type:complete len:152 (-),score=24.44 TRINITY_DN7281_c0_g1_i5:46-441(-)
MLQSNQESVFVETQGSRIDESFMEQLVTAQTAANAANAASEQLRMQVQMLQEELKQQDKSRLGSLPKAANRDKVLRTALEQIKDLEKENRNLKIDLSKKQQVLSQAKQFIKQYLDASQSDKEIAEESQVAL